MHRMIIAAAIVLGVGVTAIAQSDAIYRPGGGVTAPAVVKEVKPQYTEGAMRRKVQGTVKLGVIVNKAGAVRDDVTVIQSLDDELDQQAIAAVKQWEFKPGTKDGEAVNVAVTIELTFTLKR